jgi:hypothetical protein
MKNREGSNMIKEPKTTCGGCGMKSYDNDETDDWTHQWINILLCDDCYTQARVAVANQFELNLFDLNM